MNDIAKMGPYSISHQHETCAVIVNAAGVVVCAVQDCGQIKMANMPDTGDMAKRIAAALNLIEGIETDRLEDMIVIEDQPFDSFGGVHDDD